MLRTVREVLTSASFVEKFLLLLLTVLVSGLAVPLVLSYNAVAATQRQKAADAARARDQAILDSQSRLLDDFAQTVLTYETLALDVSWYQTATAREDEMYRRAFARYSERVVDLVARWRALSSRARTLASEAVADKMDAFLADVFQRQDTPIVQLYRKRASSEAWEAQHQASVEMLSRGHGLISELTRDLGLARTNMQAP